jgi:hypothetical protein
MADQWQSCCFQRYPFTIILKVEVKVPQEPITLKLDPGSKTSPIALVQGEKVIFGAELTHARSNYQSQSGISPFIA